ncbi:MAG: flagellin lysine-N-methylase [bacterium]|nr:flagellin lysine-N-methylase [bacterium]
MRSELYEISFFKQFSCTIKDCPNTCCKGWRVIFDEETYRRYLAEPGKNGIRLRSSIKKINEEVYFRTSLKACTFYEKEGTCNLQRTLGVDYMPKVCRLYPRFYQHYGSFAEETLFLSCPEAARLFLTHLEDLSFVKSEREIAYECWGTNEDEPFLKWLRELREEMIMEIWDETRSRLQIFAQLVAVMWEIQNRCIKGNELPPAKELIQKHKNAGELHIPAQITDQMLTNGFYHSRLKKISPKLYELCRLYFQVFDRLTPEQADLRAGELTKKLHKDHPQLEHMLRGYVVYYLQMVFLEVYEDYSFVKKLAGGIMHVHMLEMFLALYNNSQVGHWKKTMPRIFAQRKRTPDKHPANRLDSDELAYLISVYERRGRHNEDVAEGMYEKFYPILQEWYQ